jgi:N,N'-diacetyllegionaminate synthase
MISPDKVFIIAEAGVNHNGCLDRAKQMVKVAAQAGADAVKFQTFTAGALVTKAADKAVYQKKSMEREESQFEMLKKLELSPGDHRVLMDTCRSNGIEFLSSPFDLDSIDFLKELGIIKWKIPSGEITNLPYLRKIACFGQKIILSTGMAEIGEIKAALLVFTAANIQLDQITVLQCNTEYPTPMQDVNLRAIQTIKEAFPGVKTGYSDHTLGIEIPIAAIAMGASMIEKHFTLDNRLPGPDHNASVLPAELAQMIGAIRNVEKALGNGIKTPSPSEKKNMAVVRKSIVAASSIVAGELFTRENLTVKRPGTGISPMKWDGIIGGKATKNYIKDDLIDA